MTRKTVPLATLALVLTNVAVYRLEAGSRALCDAYGLIPAHFAPEALVTSTFLHDPVSLLHIAGNMAFLLLFGAIVEGSIGSIPFLCLYLTAGLAGGLLHVLVNPSSVDPLVGASGAICGVLAVAGAIRPRLLGFVVAFIGLNIFHAFVGAEGTVSFACHIGGFVAGFIIVLLMRVTGSEALEVA